MNGTRSRRRVGLAACWLLVACSHEPSPSPVTPSSTPPIAVDAASSDKLALLIGIGNYPEHTNGTFAPLRGTGNDLALVRDLLERRFGFPAARIREVRDEQATLAGIVRAFDEHLLRQAREDTEVFIYYSGHGSQIEDVANRERHRRDSTFVAWDSRIDERKGQYDLSDDCVHSLLSVLTTQNRARVTIVTDSCHSGGTVRGSRVGAARSMPAGNAPVTDVSSWDFWPADVPFRDDDERPGLLELSRCVHLAACASDETAYQYDFAGAGEPSRVHGVMTWCLVDALRRAQPDDSFRTIARRAGAFMRAMPDVPLQSMWLDGPDADKDRALFGNHFTAPIRGFDVRADSATSLRVDAGTLQGFVDDAELDVLDENGTPIGTARIVRAEVGVSRATWTAEPPRIDGTPFMLARLRARPPQWQSLDVTTADPTLVAAHADSSWARVHQGGAERAGYVLERSADGDLRLRTSEGIPIWPRPDREQALEDAFREEVDFQRFWALSCKTEPAPLDAVRLSFEPMSEQDIAAVPKRTGRSFVAAPIAPRTASAGETALPEWTAQVPSYAMQDRNEHVEVTTLRIENRTMERVFVKVLSLSENRAVVQIWPPEGSDPAEWPLPGDAEPVKVTVQLGSPEPTIWPIDRPMRDRYVAIVTRQPIDLQGFLRPTRSADAGFGAASVDVLVSPR